MPFLNAMNDFYIRDLSDRIKSVLTAKAKNGQKLSGTAPYGYDRHPKENTRLIADEYAAGVVRRIFEARAQGKGYGVIAGILNTENILPPRLYYFKRRNRETKAVCSDMWTERTIKLILHNELYIGNTISFKRKIRSYRDKREIKRDESEWIKTENTHTPIIGIDLWRAVQKINAEATNKFADSRKPQELKQKLPGDHVLDQTAQEKERRELKRQLCKLEMQIEQLYEDKVSGIISAEKFSAAVNEMETRRLEIENKYVGLC
jgi:hypothetical protein